MGISSAGIGVAVAAEKGDGPLPGFASLSHKCYKWSVAEWAVEVLNQTVEAELLALPKEMQARFLRISELLETFGPPQVGLPHVRSVGEKLWEMRLQGRDGIGRAIYTDGIRQTADSAPCICEENTENTAPID